MRWLYWPVRMAARLGVQIEFVTRQVVKRTPCFASRSRFGVRAYLPSQEP